jgi:hypothetical protein
MTMRDVYYRFIIRKHRARLAQRQMLIDILVGVRLMFQAYIEGRGEQVFEYYAELRRGIEDQITSLGGKTCRT